MKDITFASLFGGFGGVEIGAMAAGLKPSWSIECDPLIAEVAQANLGHKVYARDVLDCDPHQFEAIDVLHASPVCTRMSLANPLAGETALDIQLAEKTAEFVKVLRPKVFTLENVWAYRNSVSWQKIENTLHEAGYWVVVEHVNFANIGGLKLCPLHDSESTRRFAYGAKAISSHASLAPDIVAALAGMQPTVQAIHLAWDAVAHLAKVIRRDTAESVTRQALESVREVNAVHSTAIGRAESALTNADMFVSGSMENIDANIVLLLKICLDAPLLKAKWFTISMMAKQITFQLILKCIQATGPTYQNIIKRGRWSIPIGASEIDGVDTCPLCHHEGVPQTRKRMIVRAVRGGFVPHLPAYAARWVGWYEAIEDLLPELPESQFAPWQLARLPELLSTLLIAQSGYGGALTTVDSNEPSFSVTANHNQLGIKAFLMQVQGEGGDGVRLDSEPMQTVAANHGAAKYRAFLMGDQERQLVGDVGPAFTVRAGENGGALPKAFLLPGGGNTNFNEAYPGRGCRYAEEPAHTVTATSKDGGAVPKAWLIDGSNASEAGQLTVRDALSPSFTITSGGAKHPARALIEYGRVVAMTPRALARFQSFPDWYQLPQNDRLATKGIGNAVSPLLYQRIIESLIESL